MRGTPFQFAEFVAVITKFREPTVNLDIGMGRIWCILVSVLRFLIDAREGVHDFFVSRVHLCRGFLYDITQAITKVQVFVFLQLRHYRNRIIIFFFTIIFVFIRGIVWIRGFSVLHIINDIRDFNNHIPHFLLVFFRDTLFPFALVLFVHCFDDITACFGHLIHITHSNTIFKLILCVFLLFLHCDHVLHIDDV